MAIRKSFAAQRMGYALASRHFAVALMNAIARIGTDVDRCSFIVVDFHHLLLAVLSPDCFVQDGLPQLFVLLVEHGLPKSEGERHHHAAKGDGFALFPQTALALSSCSRW